MADFTDYRQWQGSSYPVHAAETSNLFKRVEPLLTPEQLISRFLLGVQLPDSFTNDVLKDRINIAINDFELLTRVSVLPEVFHDKLSYDYAAYRSFLFFKTEKHPIQKMLSLQIQSSDGTGIYTIPPIWIETANFHRGQVNVIPLLSTFGATQGFAQTGGIIQSAGLVFIATLGQLTWLPAFWVLKYTSGLSRDENNVPVVANNLIGCIAAIGILSNLASLNIATSVSIAQDGISQSSSTPGPQVYTKRIEDLTEDKNKYVKEIQNLFANKYYVGTI
jgi:hypothetical protein